MIRFLLPVHIIQMKFFRFNSETIWGIVLLVTLVLSIFLLPVLPLQWQAQSSRVVYTILYLSAFFSLEKRVKSILVLSVLAFCMEWIAGLFDMPILTMMSKSLNILFFMLIVVFLIRQVAMARVVNLKVILGSVIGYLLLGLIFSIFVAYIMIQDPASFNIPHMPADMTTSLTRLSESIYFSFVSMATLGYGDVLPLKPYTRSLAIFITVSGQLYIAIIIALLVGKFAAEGGKKIEN